ncbi:EAL domain-containing protein [Vibrio neonatus]|uniref:EAL domain-containing protein n=1 Tax=Vibrio neonatus TaxID=278860 RepID=UPI0021C40E82|nr:EAL domain-containing protein [Vibrio neonatus]
MQKLLLKLGLLNSIILSFIVSIATVLLLFAFFMVKEINSDSIKLLNVIYHDIKPIVDFPGKHEDLNYNKQDLMIKNKGCNNLPNNKDCLFEYNKPLYIYLNDINGSNINTPYMTITSPLDEYVQINESGGIYAYNLPQILFFYEHNKKEYRYVNVRVNDHHIASTRKYEKLLFGFKVKSSFNQEWLDISITSVVSLSRLIFEIKENIANAIFIFVCIFTFMLTSIVCLKNNKKILIYKYLSEERYVPYYQPIVNIRGEIVGTEVLARLKTPKGKIIYPDGFIDIIESNRLSFLLTKQMLLKSQSELSHILEDNPNFYFSINIASYELMNDDLFNFISSNVKYLDNLVLELTERHEISKFILIKEQMNKLNNIGVTFYLDDVGTGFSGARYLKELPIDTVKIDRSFVNISNNKDELLLRGLIGMCHGMGLKCLAEGIETLEQSEKISQMDVSFQQGYFFSKPVPINDLFEVISRFNNK